MSKNLDISNLNTIPNQNIVFNYKEYLVWLEELSKAIVLSDVSNFSEVKPNLCSFGKWLNTNGKKAISNSSNSR